MIRAAGIICKPIPEMVTAVVPELRRWLETRKVEVFVDPRTRTTLDPDWSGDDAGRNGGES